MTFIGDVKFVDGRSPSDAAALVLRRCLRCEKQEGSERIGTFLERLSISPRAFFADIDTRWMDRPFIGQHVFKVVRAAGYEGSENDLWLAVTGNAAPYRVLKRKPQHQGAPSPKAEGKARRAG